MKKVKGKDFTADTEAEYIMITKLLTGKDSEVYKLFVRDIVKGGPTKKKAIEQRINGFLANIRDLKDRQPDKDVKNKMDEFVQNIETYLEREAYKKEKSMSFSGKKLNYEIISAEESSKGGEEEEEEPIVFGKGGGRTSTPSGDPVTIPTGPKTIVDRYEEFLNDDPQAYYYLKEMIKTPKQAQELRKHIANTYGYNKASPLHIDPQHKAGEREKIFNDHFHRIAFLKELTTVPADSRKSAGDVMNKHLIQNDPQGIIFKERMQPYFESGRLKGGLTVKQLTKLKGIVNTRLALLGYPKLPASLKDKTNLRLELTTLDYDMLTDAYKEYPHLKNPKITIDKEQERASLTEEERTLIGDDDDIEEYLNNKYAKVEQEELIKSMFIDEEGQVQFKFKKIKPEVAPNTIVDIINQMIIKQRVEKVIDKVKDDKSFKQNTQDGRRNIVASELRNMKVSPDDINNAVEELNKAGVQLFDVLSEKVYGEVKNTTTQDISNLVQSISYLTPNKKKEVKKVLKAYVNILEPEYEKEFNVKVNPTINAPSDIRVLPEGIQIKEVEEPRTTADIYKEKIQQLKDISVKKVKAVGDELQALLDEEAKAREWIKDNEKEIKKMEKEGKAQTIKTTKATRRKGFLRPHLLNPTEQAVDAALNKTSEEQIQDFSNWFVFDVPIDQTGVGSTYNNPFVKQNEVRYREITDGNIFSDFNKTYDVKPDLFGGPKFYEQHAILNKEGVTSEMKDIKRKEEEDFIQKLNKDSNGLFAQDQTKEELNNFKNIYQTPNNFFTGTLYPFQDTANRSIYVSEFDKNLNYFIEP
jgi:formiminotetrahydrofolate cyclodeaminase